MAAFSGGSFNKIIFDEELMINCNRVLQGINLSIDPLLKDKLGRSLETRIFFYATLRLRLFCVNFYGINKATIDNLTSKTSYQD